jgi:hypothetical protein
MKAAEKMSENQIYKILVFRTAPEVVFKETIRLLKQAEPEAEIHVLCREEFRSSTEATSGVDKVHTHKGERLSPLKCATQISADLGGEDYSLAVLLFSSWWGEGYWSLLLAARQLTQARMVRVNSELSFMSLPDIKRQNPWIAFTKFCFTETVKTLLATAMAMACGIAWSVSRSKR